jgi:hypothetical protein
MIRSQFIGEVNYMKTFIVHSDIPRDKLPNASGWILALPKMLTAEGIRDVTFKTAYCCTPDKKVIAEFSGPDKEAIDKALSKIGMPVTAVMEATKV